MNAKILDDFFSDKEPQMLTMLEHIVNMCSFTSEGKNVEKVGRYLMDFLAAHGFYTKLAEKIEIPENEAWLYNHSNPFVARSHDFNAEPGIVLAGHLDTVFSSEYCCEHKFKIDFEHDRAYGPGVADMKAGLIANVFAAVALKENNLLSCPVTLAFSADEELGSPVSSRALKPYLMGAKAAINAEPGGVGGYVTFSRKGSGHITFNIKGKSAHAGRNYQDGASAILELAHKTLEINKFLDLSRSKTVNTGLISGGTSANSVAPCASSKIHITYQTRAEGEELVKNIKKVADTVYVEGTQTEMTGGLRLYPLERSEKGDKLFELAKEAGKCFGLELKGQHYESASDSGFYSSVLNIPTICCMGPEGDNIHTPDEYLIPSTILKRTKCIALTACYASQEF